jgi:hypothetical protein
MSNAIFHNKWHGFNHYTVPLEGYPDSATDPIASFDFPFRGIFYNSANNLRSNSLGWWFYYSLTFSNSADWEKYPTIFNTVTPLTGLWDLGYNSYQTLCAVSGVFYDNVFTQTLSLSPESMWDGTGKNGWHIALSSITHRTDLNQVNLKQKVAVPVRLYEQENSIIWPLSAQTVFYNITSTKSLTADQIIDPRRGGKYTMWMYVDRCPVENANVIFDPKIYNISVKTQGASFNTSRDVLLKSANEITLESNGITRIDFTYDGDRMLGRATRYRVLLPTTDDLYFQGRGIRFRDPITRATKSPVYVNTADITDTALSAKYLTNDLNEGINRSITIDYNFSSQFTETSSLYVPGSGISMRFLNSDNQFFNFNLIGASWPNTTFLNKFPTLTGSFDRVIGTLSGRGDFRNPVFAENLIASPDEFFVTTDKILSAYPTARFGGPYELSPSTIRTVQTCFSSYTVEIFSGKDRDITSITVNGVRVPISPLVVNCMRQPYSFFNERTATLTFERVQDDYEIEIVFGPQLPITIPGLVVWMISQDNTVLGRTATNVLTSWTSSTNNNFNLLQPLPAIAPTLVTDDALRSVSFIGSRSMQSNPSGVTTTTPLTSLSSNSTFLNGFTTFTVFRTTNVLPTSSIIWWLGDFTGTNNQGGFGLTLSGAQLYTISNYKQKYAGLQEQLLFDSTRLFNNGVFVVATVYDPQRSASRQEIYVNNTRSIFQRSFFDNTVTTPLTNFNIVVGKHPTEGTGFGRFRLYDLYIYDRPLGRGDVLRMNDFLINKINSYSNACLGGDLNLDDIPEGFIPCDVPIRYSGNVGYPAPIQNVTLGTGIGIVRFEYEAFGVPDRFIVKWDDVIVIDTGYRGGSNFDYRPGTPTSQRNNFNNNLTGKIDPVTQRTYPDFDNYPDDGYPRILGVGRGIAEFVKTDVAPINVQVEVWAPLGGTAWNCLVRCPQPIIEDVE